jgi:hypothetical protein
MIYVYLIMYYKKVYNTYVQSTYNYKKGNDLYEGNFTKNSGRYFKRHRTR